MSLPAHPRRRVRSAASALALALATLAAACGGSDANDSADGAPAATAAADAIAADDTPAATDAPGTDEAPVTEDVATTTVPEAAPTTSAPAPGDSPDSGVVPTDEFVDASQLPDHGSTAFVLIDGDYHFISMPGVEDTSISHIDTTTATAWGWSRDLPVDDPTATQWAWQLDLDTGEFTDLDTPGATWAVLQGGADAGPFVGKLADDGGTPDDDTDDATFGFVIAPVTGDVERIGRDGFDDIGFTDANSDGAISGFNDYGTLGFVYADGEFTDLEHADAYRLYPFSINDDGAVVGFWGTSEDNWFTNSVNPGFLAVPADGGYEIERYELPGFSGTGLTAIDNTGRIAGMAWETPDASPSVFVADDTTSLPELFEAPSGTSPFVTGMTDSGAIYGQVFLFPVEPESDATATADAPDAPISDAVSALGGPAHTGPFSDALHGYYHDLESGAAAAEDAAASGDTETMTAELAELAATMIDVRADVDAAEEGSPEEVTEIAALLDALDTAIADLKPTDV